MIWIVKIIWIMIWIVKIIWITIVTVKIIWITIVTENNLNYDFDCENNKLNYDFNCENILNYTSTISSIIISVMKIISVTLTINHSSVTISVSTAMLNQ